MNLSKPWNRMLWFLQWAQFKPTTFNRKRLANVRSAKNTIKLCKEIGIVPKCLVDVGANEGQWSYWLRKEWPVMMTESFEPGNHPNCPRRRYNVALSSVTGRCDLVGNDTQSRVIENRNGEIQMARFDNYFAGTPPLPSPSILKIDAETHSARALIGFGNRLNEFALVVIEVCWDNCRSGSDYRGQAERIFRTMYDYEFDGMTSVDEAVYSGQTDFVDMAFWKRK